MNTPRTNGIRLIALAACAGSAAAQTITVDTIEDRTDFLGAQLVGDLPGPDGRISFREALAAANNTPGPQTIEFAIPQSDWWLLSEAAVLKLEWGAFLVTDDQTTIDFSTQTDFTGDTNPAGREVAIYGLEPNGWGVPAIFVIADNCVIRGLGDVMQRSESISISGNNNRVVGCVTDVVEIKPYPDHCSLNVIGGTTPEDANDIDEVMISCGADDNLVIGNRISSITVGGSPYCDPASRNRIGGPTPEERNVINGFGRLGEEGFPIGQGVKVIWGVDTLIEGNYIGTNAEGTARHVQAGPSGIEVVDADNTTIRNNLIAGLWVVGSNHYAGQIFGQAILVNSINRDNLGVTIEGNIIGADHTGQNPIQTRNGIVVAQFTGLYTPHDTVIGGIEPAQGNTIAFCERVGVAIGPLTQDAIISGNSIHSNAGVGIDLSTWAGYDGVTPNDPGDTDSQGGNALQNFPVLESATATGAQLLVSGALNTRPSRQYRVEFFASDECDPSGHGEGRTFLGYTDVSTDVSGNASFDATLAASVAPGGAITATATDLLLGATSEFSACAIATGGGCPADLAEPFGSLDFSDVVAFLTAFGNQEPAADFAEPIGQFDFSDVVAFLAAFGAGCP